MKNPRGRMPSPKPGQIKVAWATEHRDTPQLHFVYAGNRLMSRDVNMIRSQFLTRPTASGISFLEELEARGYDLSTLKFSIEKLPSAEVSEGENPVAGDDPFYTILRQAKNDR